MTRTRTHQHPAITALAVVPALLSLAGAARAQPESDEPSTPAEPPTPTVPAPAPAPAPAVAGSEAPAASAPLFEGMGPDTFPGELRGLPGGSLWLEPSFHGLQWPHNSRTGIGVSGSFWVDSGYEKIKRDQSELLDSTIYMQQGRGLLRVTPAYVSGGFFIQGQAELVANLCQTPAPNAQSPGVCAVAGTFSTDDIWIRVGQWNLWDLKVGRFEGWEIYHLGMGLDPYTLERQGAGMFGQKPNAASQLLEAPSVYRVSYLHDRPTEGLAVGHIAAHFYVTDYLRFELLGKLGSDNYRSDNATGGKAYNYLGGRPTAILDLGWFKLKLGGEYLKRTEVMQTMGGDPSTGMRKKEDVEERTQMGIGGSALFIVAPLVEFGLNAALGKQHEQNGMAVEVPENSYTIKSVGGFANLMFADGWLAGVGANYAEQLDRFIATGSLANDFASQLQGFVAGQYLLAGRLYIKAVLGLAQAKFQPSDVSVSAWSNYMYSGRIRLMYLY
jgi:hypothetical protein